MRGYRLKKPNGDWGDPILEDGELDKAVRRRMSKIKGEVHLSQDGDKWGPWLSRGDGTSRLLTKTKGAKEGHAFRLWNQGKKGVHTRVVNVAPVPAKTGGSPGVDILVGFLDAEFKNQWSSLGIYVYKQIAGSGTWSDHSYVGSGWCGRAMDIHPYSIAIGDAIQAKATAEPTIVAHLRYVLWRGVPNHYPGHLHFSFEDGGAPGYCS